MEEDDDLPEPVNLSKLALELLENMKFYVEEKEDCFFIEDDIGGHEILYSECDSLRKILNHIHHISEKGWATREIIHEFTWRAVEKIGLSIEQLPYE